MSKISLAAVNITAFGAIPDDGIDDTAAIQNVLNSKTGQTISFPDGVYNISSNIKIDNPDLIVQSDKKNGAVIQSKNSNTLIFHRFGNINNMVFDNIKIHIHGVPLSYSGKRVIQRNKFVNLPGKIECIFMDKRIGIPSSITISHNYFSDCNSAVRGHMKDSIIEYNKSNGLVRHYFLSSANNVLFSNNTIREGIVGIGFLATKSGGEITGNIITSNIIRNISEEGVSFDMLGNSRDSYSRWYGEIVGYESSGDAVTSVMVSGKIQQGLKKELLNTKLIFLSNGNGKDLEGRIFRILDVAIVDSNIKFRLEEGLTSDILGKPNLNGTKIFVVALSYLIDKNTISDNRLSNIGRTAISLHGAGFNTKIIGNRIKNCNTKGSKIWGGIVIRNITNARATLGQHGPTFFNSVTNNYLEGNNCNLAAFTLDYSRLKHQCTAIGNTQSGNILANGAKLIWRDQEDEKP